MRQIIRRTKLLKTRNSSSDDNHDDLWDLIPWYVNGTLSSEQHNAVKSRMVNNHDFALEVARQQQLAKHVATSDPFEAPVSRSWEMLRAQIEAEKPRSKPAFNLWSWLGKFKTGFLIGGAGAVACLLAIAVFVPTTSNNTFQTLTSTDTNSQATIKFQIGSDVDTDSLPSILSRYGLELQSGPTETGVYTTKPKQGEDLAALSKALMSAPEIIFASPAD